MTSSETRTTVTRPGDATTALPTRVVGYVLVPLVAGYVLWTVPGVRPDAPGFRVLLDGLLQGACYVLTAVLAALWARRRRSSAAFAWTLVAALALRALGFVLTLTFAGLGDPLPFPSVADAAWVAASLAVIGAVVLRLRDLAPRLPLLVVLDAVSVSLLLVGLVIHLLSEPLRTLTSTPGIVTDSLVVNSIYPVLDVALLVALAALVSVARARLERADLLLIGGVVALVVVDVSYFILLADGAWRPGNLFAGVSVLGTVAVALAVREAPPRPSPGSRLIGELPAPTPAPGVAVPATLIALALVALAFTSVSESVAATLTLIAGALVSIVRGVSTVDNNRVAASAVLGVATTDLKRFQALVEASTDLIGMADSDGRILYLNPGGRRLLKVPEDRDVRTMSVSEVVPGSGDASFASRWPLLLERGSWEGEAEILPVDGSAPVPVAISTFVMRDPDTGTPFGLATIQRDIREVRRQEAALRDVAEQRARLLQRLVEAQEAERAQIAADVHDDPVQALAVVDLRMSVLRRRAAAAAPDLVATVEDVQKAVSDATDRLRHLLFDLESPAHEIGLRSALATAAGVVFADTDIDWEVDGPDDLRLGEAERITAYRVAREAMVNARKHADPTCVTITLGRVADELVVTVSDDGPGFDPAAGPERPGHLGLAGMHDRASVAGGRLSITTPPSGGTQVRLALPAPPASPAAG